MYVCMYVYTNVVYNIQAELCVFKSIKLDADKTFRRLGHACALTIHGCTVGIDLGGGISKTASIYALASA